MGQIVPDSVEQYLASLNQLADPVLRAIEREGTEQGLPIVDLYVEGDNAPALKVYRNLGFQDWKKDVLYSSGAAG